MENSSAEEPDFPQREPGDKALRNEEEATDRRMLYFIIGGILLAFAIGLIFLTVAMVIDWKP